MYQGHGAGYRSGVAYGAIFGPYGAAMTRPSGAAAGTSSTSKRTGSDTTPSNKTVTLARRIQTTLDEAITKAYANKPGQARSKIAAARGLASKASAADREWFITEIDGAAADVEQILASLASGGGGGGGGFTFPNAGGGVTAEGPLDEDPVAYNIERRGLPWWLVAGVGVALTGAGLWAATGRMGGSGGRRKNPRRRRGRGGRR